MCADNSGVIFTCSTCRNRSVIPLAQAGKPGNCPVCDARATFPKAPASAVEKITFTCCHCGTTLSAPASKRNQTLPCPKCGKETPVAQEKKPNEEELAVIESEGPAPKQKQVKRKAYLAWEEMEKKKRDTYPQALLRALSYPIGEIGAIGFFVVGIPLAVALLDALSAWAITTFGGGETPLVVSGIVVAQLLALAAVVSVLATFLFAICRVTVAGGNTAPVIQGLNHRASLESAAGWVAIYLGPALALGLKGSGPLFTFSGGVIISLALLLPLAPLSLLFLSVGGGGRLFEFDQQWRILSKTAGAYALLLFVLVASSILYVFVGHLLNGMANEALSGKEPSYLMSGLYRFAAGCFYLFPLVTGARLIGLYGRYHQNVLPYPATDCEPRMSYLPGKCALLFGLCLLFLPIDDHAQIMAGRADRVETCRRNLEAIKSSCRQGDRYRWIRDEAALFKRFPQKAICSFHSGERTESSYTVVPLPGKMINELMVIYDKEGNHPDGSRCVLFAAGDLRILSAQKFEMMLKHQQHVLKYPHDEARIRDMRTLRIMP
ncbi:MAG: hypothetical protein ACYTGH_11720 [Planctomycetota bacterium]|jgi:hypothetical protein